MSLMIEILYIKKSKTGAFIEMRGAKWPSWVAMLKDINRELQAALKKKPKKKRG